MVASELGFLSFRLEVFDLSIIDKPKLRFATGNGWAILSNSQLALAVTFHSVLYYIYTILYLYYTIFILYYIYTILYYTILYYTRLYYTRLYYTRLYYTRLYYARLYYTRLYYTRLYYTRLYYTILYYTRLYYTILYHISSSRLPVHIRPSRPLLDSSLPPGSEALHQSCGYRPSSAGIICGDLRKRSATRMDLGPRRLRL